MKPISTMKSLAGLLVAGLLGTAQAAVVDFQDVASAPGGCAAGQTSIQSQGFTFTPNANNTFLFICDAGVIQNNTSNALVNANLRSHLTMAESGGAAFSLTSFFAGGRTADFDPSGPVTNYSVANGIDILGYLVGGGTVFFSVDLDRRAPYDWEQFVLPSSFTNLSSVVFRATSRRGDTPEFLIDDIVVNRINRVPEPASLALLGMALAGLGLARRRRNQA